METLTTTTGLRQQWRRLAAVLQFLDHLIGASDVPTLVRALVHAVAVWLDGDARIYQRDAGGDYVLHTSLPGVDVPERARRVHRSVINPALSGIHAISSSDFGEAGAGAVYVIPLATAPEPEWILVICAPVEAVDEPVMTVVARVAGIRLEALESESCRELRERVAAAVQMDGRSSDLMCLDAVATVLAEVGGVTGALWMDDRGQVRRLASVGAEPVGIPVAPTRTSCAANRCTLRLPLGPDAVAWLDVLPSEGTQLRLNSPALLREAGLVLQPWLSGAAMAARQVAGVLDASELQAFGERLDEELARARRFDLRLSLVLVDIGADRSGEAHLVSRLQDELRRELRGSDVLGRMDAHQLAALLIETDAQGIGAVADRLKRRLVETAEALNLTTISIGHAALSPTCRTAYALVGHARRHAEPVIKH